MKWATYRSSERIAAHTPFEMVGGGHVAHAFMTWTFSAQGLHIIDASVVSVCQQICIILHGQ